MLLPRENHALFGHGDAQAAFEDARAGGRMHHAWLLAGPPGIGKATLGYNLARRLLLPGTDAHDPASAPFRRVARGSHADLLTIERAVDPKTRKQKREVSVDQVREVAEFMHLTAVEGGWRVVLIDGVEDLNRNAANALLKVLEEPPKRAILLLTSDTPGRLLPTVRSRCRQLRLTGLMGAEMTAAMDHLLPELDSGERARLAAMTEGAPGRAVAMAGEGALALADLAREALVRPGLPLQKAYEVADKVSRADDGFSAFMASLQAGVVGQVRDAARGGRTVLADRPLAEWGEVWHALRTLHDDTERFNLDKRTAVVAALGLLTRSN